MKAFIGIQARPRVAHWASAALLTAVLTACGGGGGDDDTGSPQGYSFSGTVTAIEGPGSIRVGNVLVAASQLPAGLQVGSQVEIEGLLDNGVVQARSVRLDDSPGSSSSSSSGVVDEIEGRITAFSSNISFTVGGIPVDASGSSAVPSGLGVGAYVEVYGLLVDGVMRATFVKRDDPDGDIDDQPDDSDGRACDDDVDPSCDDSPGSSGRDDDDNDDEEDPDEDNSGRR